MPPTPTIGGGDGAPVSRTERILSHIALYRVTFRPVLEHLFFSTASSGAGNTIQALLDSNRVVSRGLGGGPLRYYQLSSEEAARRAVAHRALPPGGQALPEAIAVLWFCAMSDVGRYRLERHELFDLFGARYPKGAHCVEEREPTRVLRLYAPGARTKPAMIVHTLSLYIERARKNPSLATWLANRLYGFVVLATDQGRRERLERAISQAALEREASVTVAYAPDEHTIATALRTHAELHGRRSR